MGYKSIVLNSKNSYNKNKDQPEYYFNTSIFVHKYKLENLELPLTFFTINSSNNSLVINNGTTDATITIPVGDYTSTSICSTLETLLNAAPIAEIFTVTYSTVTYKVTIACSGTFKILSSSTCQSWLGLGETDTSLVASYTCPNVLDLTGPKSVYVVSSELSSDKVLYGGERMNIIAKVPLHNAKGAILYYEDAKSYGWATAKTDLSTLSLRLLDADTLKPIELNGSSWSCTLGYSDDTSDLLY
jgi:hypothetical protein